jgi:TPR repeat protein
MGCFYSRGKFIRKSKKKAFEWFLKAAKQGIAEAQYEVASMYDNGIGVEQDSEKASWWYKEYSKNNEEVFINDILK